jgi:hypothetical protein
MPRCAMLIVTTSLTTEAWLFHAGFAEDQSSRYIIQELHYNITNAES